MSNQASVSLSPSWSESRINDPAPGALHFGIGTFAFQSEGPAGTVSGAQVIRDVVEEAVTAEGVGLDSFGIAEHYRKGMMDSAGPVILGAIAARTTTLRVGTAVTVLSTQDPVRVYNEFATLDALSHGRAQMIVGRGSAIESFPLFGFDLGDYEDLFEEKLGLLMQLLRSQPVTWTGRFRPPLFEQVLEPTLAPGAVPVWVGVGGSPQSVIRAARFGLPLMLGIIGGTIERFAPLTTLYRQALSALDQVDQPVGMHVHGFIADSDEEAIERFWPVWSGMMNAEAPKRGWAPFRRDRYDAEVAGGALFVGSAETVARRIAASMGLLGATRFDFVAAASRMDHAAKTDTIERFGLEVVPRVRRLLADMGQENAGAA
ncbi:MULTISPECIES: LLM class flavin-dependent oxidoreductase [unclassified Microbacterium]|uniref:LLM class flavin-dependent oxidoreductase n=1 Tax=unclassified Microbacterium TaxID=2609290 RepID=UPI00214BFAC5|nr:MULTISPECIES: LLM class flavin-dependent oxidoreductase [unclassified Microbacterium]MCR2784777.1 LLM class flavin-dependent oxidoreductase [Microbacterium sp. zg.B96]WIM16316.1 LLM class flavin-dependent oxidoreductase [Microbacterium sp. zg-B96]